MSETPALVRHLQELAAREDRGALAALRRGLGKPPGTATACIPHVAPFVPDNANKEGRDWPFYTVACLFALHPSSTQKGDFGGTCRKLGESESAEKRFQSILSSDASQVPSRLRRLVALARSKEIPINWSILLRDLRNWDHPDRWVQREWARSYWGSTPADE